MQEVLKLENINKSYEDNKIITDATFTINRGDCVAFVGPSGCGKTTLLQICGLLDDATGGNLYVGGKNINSLNDQQRTEIRKNNIGFVFQFHHLLPEFSVIENVLMPSLIDNKNYKQKALELLDKLGLANKIFHTPNQLSGGERQRVAIARAIINEPSIILADEPTGNLDEENAKNVFELLLKIVKEYNSALLMVTHNYELAKQLDKIITLRDKKIEFIKS